MFKIYAGSKRRNIQPVLEKLTSHLVPYFLWCLVVSAITAGGEASFARSSSDGYCYAGLEFFGSSQMTRAEIESELHLKPGASSKAVDKAVENLKQKLDNRRLMSNVEIVSDAPDKLFVVVDFIDPTNTSFPYRVLANPHHVMTKSEKPEQLLLKLKERLAYLQEENRSWTDSYPGGVRMFSDEAANQIVNEIRSYGQVMREEWLEVVASDPEAQRRCDAIELLNWGGEYADTCARILPAIDDTDHYVRGSVVRFIYPRMSQLPDNFTWVNLAAGLCRQLKRPSNEDRVKAMNALLLLMKVKPISTGPIMQTCQKDVERFLKESRISSVRKASREMLMVFSQPLPRIKAPSVPDAGF